MNIQFVSKILYVYYSEMQMCTKGSFYSVDLRQLNRKMTETYGIIRKWIMSVIWLTEIDHRQG